MYCCSKKSGRRTVHTDACYHIRPIAKTDLTWFATTEEALQEGRRLCRDCCPIVRFVEEDMAELTDYCRKHSSHIFLHSQYIGVRTPCGSWRIGLNAHKSGLSLYHKNVRPAKKKQTEPIPGYHLQNTRQRSVRDYLDYILDHEYYRMMHPVSNRPAKKEPPRKGTKRYKKQQEEKKHRAQKRAVSRVLRILDSLSTASA